MKQQKFPVNTPGWVILLSDMLITGIAVILAYLLRFNFSIPESELRPLPWIMLYILAIRCGGFLVFRSYTGTIRYTGASDAFRVLSALFSGSLLFGLTNLVTYQLPGRFFFIPFSIIIIEFLSTAFGMIFLRMVARMLYPENRRPRRARIDVVIYGTGEEAHTAARVLLRSREERFRVVAFLDDDPARQGKKFEGTPILHPDRLEKLFEKGRIDQVVLSLPSLDTLRKLALAGLCHSRGTKLLKVPPASDWINHTLSKEQICGFRIEDMLNRGDFHTDPGPVRQYLKGKVVLVTGAAGSIGSELVRQVAAFQPAHLVLLDIAETPLHAIRTECQRSFPDVRFSFILGNICHNGRMRWVMESFCPAVVFHAAAYKHVHIQEAHPAEAVRTNVEGARIMADLAAACGTGKFVMISTEKAAHPSEVGGASKRIAEMYIQSLHRRTTTQFITTRLGNLPGSVGSEAPLCHWQIREEDDGKLFHPDAARYFITVAEVCRLILESGAIGCGGEVFILRTDKPPALHPHILAAHLPVAEYAGLSRAIDELSDLVSAGKSSDIPAKMKEIVPECTLQI